MKIDNLYWKEIFDGFVRRNVTFNKKLQIEMLEDAVSLLKSGVTVLDMFVLFTKNYDNGIKNVAQSAIRALNNGMPLSSGLKSWFPAEVITAIHIGEERGVLPETLDNIIRYLKTSSNGIGLFISKSAYGIAISAMAFFMAAILQNKFYGTVETIKPISEWPPNALVIYNFWGFLLSVWPLILIILFILFLVLKYQITNLVGPLRQKLDQLLIFKQYRLQQGAIFLTTLGLLLKNGISIKTAFEELESRATPYMRYHIHKMQHKVETGIGNEGDFINTGLLEEETVNRLKTLSESNDFEQTMMLIGQQTNEITAKKLQNASEIVRYLFMALGGILYASIFLGTTLLSQTFT